MKVSVITTAYNHQDTLERSIKSVRSQIGVEFEHIVIDDTETNNGMMKTFQEAFSKCSGEYIALCDGDDIWIDNFKLKHQVDYMDNNVDCALCFTRVYTERNGFINYTSHISTDYINKNISFDSLLRGSAFLYAQGYMIRRSDFIKHIDLDEFVKYSTWDLFIVLELIKHKRFYCLPFYSAVFTVNDESVTNTRSRVKRFRYVMGNYKIKLHYIFKYGCKLSTIFYLIYKFTRDTYSIIFKRWLK